MSRKNDKTNKNNKNDYTNQISNMQDSFESAAEFGDFSANEFKKNFKAAKDSAKKQQKNNYHN